MHHASQEPVSSRREFLKRSSAAAAGATLLSRVPAVHAAQDNTIRLAVLGCGGRGTGAVIDALSVPEGGPIELYAAADLYDKAIDNALNQLKQLPPAPLRCPTARTCAA